MPPLLTLTERSLIGLLGSPKRSATSTLPPPPASSTEPRPDEFPTDWRAWLRDLFPEYFTADFADFHADFWSWVWALERRVRPVPYVGIWPRDTGKSTSAEAACVAVAARGVRRYGLYVCRTQDQSDDHVQNVAALLESEQVDARYPALSDRLIGKFGASKGWRHNRLRTRDGFTLDAVGLDRAVRGIKIEEQRPDFMVLDDLDNENDSPVTVTKNVRTLTRKVLQLGSDDVAVLAVQNLVHDESVFGRLAGTASVGADFLADRTVSGPHKAINGLTYERRGTRTILTGGEPTWPAGLDLVAAQKRVDRDGIDAFLAECQHERQRPEGVAFPEWRREVHVCAPFKIPSEWPRWRMIDYGYGVPYCCLWAAQAPSGTLYVYRETYRAGLLARDQALEVRSLSAGERIRATFADPSMWAERHNGIAIQSPAAGYAEMGVLLTPANNSRRDGVNRWHELLAWAPAEEGRPMLPPQVQVFDTCSNLIRILPDLVKDPHDPEDVDTTGEDHAYDAGRYGFLGISAPVARKVKASFG